MAGAPAFVEMFSKSECPYCVRAKALLRARGVTDLHDIDIGQHPAQRAVMLQRAPGRHTVPQIFINGRHVGGCDDLHALDAQGGLQALLAQSPAS